MEGNIHATQFRPTLTITVQCWAASQPIAGTMPVDRSRRWPSIETELGDCSVFALTAIRVTLSPPIGHYPDNIIHCPNYEIMLGHRLQRWANITPTKTL